MIKILGTIDKPHVKHFDISECRVSTENGAVIMRGYANTKGNKDRYGDIPTVFPALRTYVYELKDFVKNPVMLLNHSNSVEAIAGSFKEIKEDDIGLKFVLEFSKSDFPSVAHARTVALEGHAKALSMAGRWHFEDKDNPNHLTYAEIYHISMVGVGADPNALGFTEKEKTAEDEEVKGTECDSKPYPNEHAARIEDPDKYESFRRQNDKFGKGIHAIFGIIMKPERKSELQAIRFDKTKFTVAEAKAWLNEHKIKYISFEPASESMAEEQDLKIAGEVIDNFKSAVETAKTEELTSALRRASRILKEEKLK